MQEIIDRYLSEGFEYAVASKPLTKIPDKENSLFNCTKIKIRPVDIKGKVMFQTTNTVGAKELHENLEKKDAVGLLLDVAGKPFGNIEVVNAGDKLCILSSKKGNMTCQPVCTTSNRT